MQLLRYLYLFNFKHRVGKILLAINTQKVFPLVQAIQVLEGNNFKGALAQVNLFAEHFAAQHIEQFDSAVACVGVVKRYVKLGGKGAWVNGSIITQAQNIAVVICFQ